MTESIAKPIPTSDADAALDESIQFADEVVTHAHCGPSISRSARARPPLITLDNGLDHTKPNTFGPGGYWSSRPRSTRLEARPAGSPPSA